MSLSQTLNQFAQNLGRYLSKRNLIGSDIQRLCAAHDEMEAHPDDPAYDIIPVKLHDGFVYEIHRQKYPHPAADLT